MSATFGVTSLCLGGFASWPSYTSIWLTWWLGDGVSNVVVAPLLVLWSGRASFIWARARIVEAAVLFPLLVATGQAVFGGLFTFRERNYPLEFLCIPLLIWAAFRFGGRGATLAIFILYPIAIRGTLHGLGPFAIGSRNESSDQRKRLAPIRSDSTRPPVIGSGAAPLRRAGTRGARGVPK